MDVLLDHNEHTRLADVTTPVDYSEEVRFALGDIYSQMFENLQSSKTKMQQRYNMNIRFNYYKPGEKVWLKTKHYKSGEHRKLSPRRNGPWRVLEKLHNGVNFCIIHDHTRQSKIVHPDRLSPVQESELSFSNPPDSNLPPNRGFHNPYHNSFSECDSSDSSDSSGFEPDVDSSYEFIVELPRQYPRRIRTQRRLPGQIPWSAFDSET